MSPSLRIGSLFSGYGGLDMAVEQFFGAETAWVSDIDKGACKILAYRYPDTPNLGDITKIDWTTVEPVDIITGGSPCQDLSHAGKRGGMTGSTRSNLWVSMREAIAALRPSTVVWENVRGAYSARADSDLGPCEGCMDDPRKRGPVLRALGRVLGDLSSLGYDCRWQGLRASDVGAPHGRFRVFVLATDTQSEPGRVGHRDDVRAGWGAFGRGSAAGRGAASDSTQPERGGPQPEHLGAPAGSAAESGERSSAVAWGDYEPAIRRWESLLGRVAPAPTETGPKGGQRLSPAFVEWMMGLPLGHVTEVVGLTRNEQLKALGNGVVPAQAFAALCMMASELALPVTQAGRLFATPTTAIAVGGPPQDSKGKRDLRLDLLRGPLDGVVV